VEVVEIIRGLIEEGEKLLPLGGDIVEGSSAEHQSDYVAWRLRTIAVIKRLGDDAEPFLRDLSEDKRGPYFYTSSARRVLGALKGALAVAEMQPNAKEPGGQEAEHAATAGLFPVEIVGGTRGYVEKIAEQANGCYVMGWYDACAVMVRRLIEILIIDNFEAKGKLSDIRETRYSSVSSQASEQPTASDIRRFLEEDFAQLETALNDVRVSLGGSPLDRRSATDSWGSITLHLTEVPDNICRAFGMIIETRDSARGAAANLTATQLDSAKRGINEILRFLQQRFPSAGVELPDQGEIVSLSRLIQKYLAVDDAYWQVERTAGSALGKIKTIGDIGAHGRYVKVTKQTLDKYQDALITAIQQLVGTAYDE
jgi:hypothetical protein